MKYIKTIVLIVLIIALSFFAYAIYMHKSNYTLYSLQKELNLEQWDVSITYENADIKYAARIEIVPEYYQATIFVNEAIGRPLTRHELIHELLHIHVSELQNYVLTTYPPKSKKDVEKLRYYNERLVESLTRTYN